MSLVAGLNKEDMTCWCPACGDIVDVEEDDFEGDYVFEYPEYDVICPHCHQLFYVSEGYN
jgi:Zn finger protein HypA/HybF involved in hydrogenase expression